MEQSIKIQKVDRFEFLDGYRGTLALVVVLVHASGLLGNNCYAFLAPLSQKYSIAGFFLLSSFLLTYRLIREFHKPNSDVLLATLQYFIRRFCRIYIIFIAFCIAGLYMRWLFGDFLSGSYTDLKSTLTLRYAGNNILWTIPPELRFYFVIPLVSVAFYKAGRFQPLVFCVSIVWTLYDQVFNFFGVSWEKGVSYGSEMNYRLENHFFVFFIGSQLAMAFFLGEKYENFAKIIKSRWIQIAIIVCSIFVSVYAFYFHTGVFQNFYDFKTRSRPAAFWSIVILLCLWNDSPPNPIVLFFNLKPLRKCGKYSFGIYLLHPGAIWIVSKSIFTRWHFTFFPATLLVSYFFAMAFFNLVEDKLINLANFLCRKLASLEFFQNESIDFVALPTNVSTT